MRSKLASTTGRALYRRRKALAEPVLGILKEQTRDAAVPDAWAEKCSRGVCHGYNRVEPDAHVAAQPARETSRVEQIRAERPTTFAG